MKKISLLVFGLVLVLASSPVLAQQQINNDGASADEIQPQTTNIQNNAGSSSYRASDITNDVGNSDTLKNAKVNNLGVVGAPASAPKTEPSRGPVSWAILGFGLLLVLMAPALLYARDYRSRMATGQDIETPPELPEEPTDDSVDLSDQTDETISQENIASSGEKSAIEASSSNPTSEPKAKSKKKTARKSKRSKKKK